MLVRALFATAFVASQPAYNLQSKLFTLQTRAKTFHKSFTNTGVSIVEFADVIICCDAFFSPTFGGEKNQRLVCAALRVSISLI